MQKKLIGLTLALATILALAACGDKQPDTATNVSNTNDGSATEQNHPPVNNENEDTGNADQAAKIIADFNSLLQTDGKLPDAIVYLQQHIDSVGEEQVGQMLISLEDAQTKALPALEARFYEDGVQQELMNNDPSGKSMDELISKLSDGKVKDLIKETQGSGFRLNQIEGTFTPVIDYEAYLKYEAKASKDIAAYFKLRSEEAGNPALRDAAIAIGLDQLLDRALEAESFTKSFPTSLRYNDVKSLFEQYKHAIFYGSDNSPLFSYDTHLMNKEAHNTYSAYLSKANASESQLLTALQQYMDTAAKSNYKDSDALKKLREEFAGKS
jgi:predicted small lipoprotein YifL